MFYVFLKKGDKIPEVSRLLNPKHVLERQSRRGGVRPGTRTGELSIRVLGEVKLIWKDQMAQHCLA